MKKIFMIAVALCMTTMAFAQFEKGTKYVGLSTSGLSLTYSGLEKGRLALSANAGYFLMDCVSANAEMKWDTNVDGKPAMFDFGVQGRYYMIQNGIYLAAGCKYRHAKDYNDFLPAVEVGYAFYLNHYITIEPAIYYEQSFKNHSDFSKVGFKIGAGFYF